MTRPTHATTDALAALQARRREAAAELDMVLERLDRYPRTVDVRRRFELVSLLVEFDEMIALTTSGAR
jgi:hypothetical protein